MSYQKNYPNGWQSGEAGGTPITPAALDNMENGIANALPKDGTDPMTADLPMGGHRVTGLGEPVENGDAVPRGYANSHFAPSGYGYGGVLPQTGSANDPDGTILEAHLNNRLAGMKNGEAKQIRWITYPFLDGKWRIGTLFRSSDTQAVLTGVACDGAEVRKTYNNGTWGDFEWFNPPMALGVPYRTTERVTIDGVTKPVFALEFTTGEMTHGAMMNFHNSDITIVRCEVRCRNHVLPYYGGGDLVGGAWSIWYDITGKTFEARMGSGYTSNNYTVRVWYAE